LVEVYIREVVLGTASRPSLGIANVARFVRRFFGIGPPEKLASHIALFAEPVNATFFDALGFFREL
jgi:hypothetical protein